jgi:hypothetical protein
MSNLAPIRGRTPFGCQAVSWRSLYPCCNYRRCRFSGCIVFWVATIFVPRVCCGLRLSVGAYIVLPLQTGQLVLFTGWSPPQFAHFSSSFGTGPWCSYVKCSWAHFKHLGLALSFGFLQNGTVN